MNIRKIIKNKFNDIKFIDMKNFPLKNHEFADLEHLNKLGAKKYSTYFNKLLENNNYSKIYKW